MMSARIELKKGPFYGIDETMPASLQDYMSKDEWSDFADTVQRTTKGLNYTSCLPLLFFIAYIVSIFTFYNPRIIATFFVIFIVSIIGIQCYFHSILRELHTVCEEFSTPDRTLHVRYQREYQGGSQIYLELSVNRTAMTPLNPEAVFVKDNYLSSRRDQLEHIKHLLSPQEYKETRAQILGQV